MKELHSGTMLIRRLLPRLRVLLGWRGCVTTDSSANKISMKLGLGAISRLGVTADDVAAIKNGTITMPAGYVSETTTLETGAAAKGPGTYNLVGNWNKKAEPTGSLENPLTHFRLQIQRNNTGYYLRY